jgi:hypothetical protein
MSKFKVGATVGTTTNWHSYGITKSSRGVVQQPIEGQRSDIVRVKWQDGVIRDFHQSYLVVKEPAALIHEQAFVKTSKGTASFNEKPYWIRELIDLGVLRHFVTNVYDTHVTFGYTNDDTEYTVNDYRTNSDLLDKYKQEK